MPGRFEKEQTEPVVSALFLAEPESAPRARKALDALEALMSLPTFADLRLLVSELVANSVEHSGAQKDQLIGLDVYAIEERVRVEVSDPGPGFDLPHTPTHQPWEAEYGRGLLDRRFGGGFVGRFAWRALVGLVRACRARSGARVDRLSEWASPADNRGVRPAFPSFCSHSHRFSSSRHS